MAKEIIIRAGDHKRRMKKAAMKKKADWRDYDPLTITDDDNGEDMDFERVQSIIDKYNSYGPGAFSLKEEPLGSEFYSLIKADSIEGENPVVITQGDLFDIEDRMKQIIREHGLTNL